MERLRVDGKFLRVGEQRAFLKMVTYGPFPVGLPADFAEDFRRVREAGFDSLRVFEWPTAGLLDEAQRAGLKVMAGLGWSQVVDFLRTGGHAQAMSDLSERLEQSGGHPALTGVFVGNEVPSDLVRWMGPGRVREVIEELIALGKSRRPGLIWCYGNYPATEYLEPGNADLTAMNVYLEREEDFRAYLRRLHHVAGDRPVIISEFGLDSRRNGVERQAEVLTWAVRAAREEGMAGLAVFAWSDRWRNGTLEVGDWDFGLTDRDGRDKPALASVRRALSGEQPVRGGGPEFSVIVCTRNGRSRIEACLRAVENLRGVSFETVLVEDGSEDGTADFVEAGFPWVRVVRIKPSGLGAARNAGAEMAQGEVLAFTDDDCEPDPEWLLELAPCFAAGWDAAGGPNLTPPPQDGVAAIVAAAPGAASHVMLDDVEAEHVPGCNLAVRRATYFEIGGFDVDFRTAGDDVDFCWRLRDAGHGIGFAPNSFVWHHRRSDLAGYLRQQLGYGRAEALLMGKHPKRFSPSGDAMWGGTIYTGAPVRARGSSVIYHGPMGTAGYQGLIARMQPLRDLDLRFDTPWNRALLRVVSWLAPRLRAKQRIGRFRGPVAEKRSRRPERTFEFAALWEGDREGMLRLFLADGWSPGGPSEQWDLCKAGSRVLVALEGGGGPVKRALLRIWDCSSEARRTLEKAKIELRRI